jgi:hypothetical protein
MKLTPTLILIIFCSCSPVKQTTSELKIKGNITKNSRLWKLRPVPRLHSNSPQPNKELSESPSGRLRYIIKSQIVMHADTHLKNFCFFFETF